MDNEMKNKQHNELADEIIESAVDVHAALGTGLVENVYKNLVAWDLQLKGKKVSMWKEYEDKIPELQNKVSCVDIIVDDAVMVHITSVEPVGEAHVKQIQQSLRISQLRVGLVINFAQEKLKYEKIKN